MSIERHAARCCGTTNTPAIPRILLWSNPVMSYIFKTLICPAALQPALQSLMVQLSGPAGADMFTTGLSASGTAPATHYVSSGAIGVEFELPLSSPEAMHQTCTASGAAVTLAQCEAIFAACEIVDTSTEDVHATLNRLGLKLVETAE